MAEAFPISGNIDPKTFPFLLADLHRQGATGSLKVEGPSYPKALYFRGGRILFGSSNDPKDQLGAILIEEGKITQEQLDEVNTKVGPGNPLAKVLAESGFVNQRELSEAARVKVERILSDVVSYTAGSFEFEDGVLPKGAVDLKLSTEKLVVAAVARLADRAFVLRHIDSLTVVLRTTPEIGEKMAELRPDAGDLPERLDGQRTLKEAAALTRLDEFEAAKIACALLFLRLVERVPEGGAEAQEGNVLDLAEEAQIGFGDPEPAPPALAASMAPPALVLPLEPAAEPAAAEPAFFVPETDDEPSLSSTVPRQPAPRFAESETPPLGITKPAPVAAPPPPVPAEPEAEPELPSFSLDPPTEEVTLPVPAPPPVAPSPPPAPPPPAPAAFSDLGAPPPALSFEDEAPAPTPRPSREDLAALDALLNPSASMRSTSVAASRPRAERWEPQMRPAGPGASTMGAAPSGSARSRPNRRRSGFPVVPVALGVGLLTALGLGAWYYFGGAPKAAPRPVARATPAPRPPSPVPTATATPEAAPTATPDTLPATPSPAATAPSTPPPSTPATPAVTRPTPPPTTMAVAPNAPGGVAGARQLLGQRQFAAAARGFAEGIRSSREARFSVQLLVACADETVEKALANAGTPELLILPVTYKGRSCYRLCWGLFESEASADAAARSVPPYFREGGAKPKVAPVASLLP